MKFFTWKRLLLLSILLGVGTTLYLIKFQEEQKDYEYQTIEKSDITQKVSVTGKVKPIDESDLTFENNGKIQEVYVKVGDSVKSGDTLVKLTNQELWAQKTEAIANLRQVQAQLKEAQKGNREEEVQIQISKKSSSETTLKNAEQDLEIEIREAFTTASFIVRNTLRGLTYNPGYNRSKIAFATTHTTELGQLNHQLFYLDQMVKNWESEMHKITTHNLDLTAQKVEKNLDQLKVFVDDLVGISHTFHVTVTQSQSKLDSWKNSISSTQSNINTAISGLRNARQNLLIAQKSLDTSAQELNLTQVGTREEQIEMYEAAVLGAQARVAQIQAQINKTILYAPFDGIITKVNAKKGEVISLMTAKEILISMIGEGYEIELNVPEIDVAKINIDDPVEIMFDAFDDHTFESVVKFIEPAETEVGGVTYYQVKIALDPKDIELEIRSGMSVDVDIITARKENIIKVPQRRVIRDGNEKIVRILETHNQSQEVVEVGVQTGIRDTNGHIEILSGLKEGDKLLLE